MTDRIDLSRFHAFLDPRLTADAVIQGTLQQQLHHIKQMIADTQKKGLSEITIDAVGMDRALISKVLKKTSPHVTSVASITIQGTQLKIILQPSQTQEQESSALDTCKNNQTTSSWPVVSPDESDHLAQGRHLRMLERLLSAIWKTAEEKKASFYFDATGFDRLLLADVTHLILPGNQVTFNTLQGLMNIAIRSDAAILPILPFVKPDSRMKIKDSPREIRLSGLELKDAAIKRSREILPEVTLTSFSLTPPPSSPNSAITESTINTEMLQFIEIYLAHCMTVRSFQKTSKKSVQEFLSDVKVVANTDPLLMQHFRLGLESALSSEEMTTKGTVAVQEVCRNLQTVDDYLGSIEKLDPSVQKIVKNAVGAAIFQPFLTTLRETDLKPAFKATLIRKEIESRTYEIPDEFFKNQPPISEISFEQIDRSYWTLNLRDNPLAHIFVNHMPVMPYPRSTSLDDSQRRKLFYVDLIKTLAKASKNPLAESPESIDNLFQIFLDFKPRTMTGDEMNLLTLLRAGSFSMYGHADTYLRKYILKNLSFKGFTNTVPKNVEFDFVSPTECVVTRKVLYGFHPIRVASFIFESKISVNLTPPIQFKMTLSLPFFNAEELKTSEERKKLYSSLKNKIAKSSE